MRLGDDLGPRAIWIKGWLFLALALMASVALLALYPTWETALLLAIALWATARWYYFMFYVIEKYVDPTFRFAGLASFARYVWRRRASGTVHDGNSPSNHGS